MSRRTSYQQTPRNKFKSYFGERLPAYVSAVVIGALGAIGASHVVVDSLKKPSVEQTAIDLSPADPHVGKELPPLTPAQARKKMAYDVKMTAHGGGYWVGGYVEDGVTHHIGGGDIENPDTYLTAGQTAELYNFTLGKNKDPDVATHRSVAHSIEMYGTHEQQIKLSLAQRAIKVNIEEWNVAGHKLGTSQQTKAGENLDESNEVTHTMLRQLRDALPKS